ncbi:MAG: transcription factor FapR [bacterium]
MDKFNKEKRQRLLKNLIDKNPFLTDKELAKKFKVSVHTIRHDRLELGIPEVRERTKNVAKTAYNDLKSVSEGEVIGDLVRLKLNQYAESFLKAKKEMALQSTKIIRGHHLFAQANSLAVAIINTELVLTANVEVKFIKPAFVGDILMAKAKVKNNKKDKFEIKVNTFCHDNKIFSGDFTMFVREHEEVY